MPTSDRSVLPPLALAGLLALAACDPATMSGAGATPTRTKLNVAGRAVTIAPPPGFCIDPDSVASGADGAFVLMSDCRLLAGNTATASARPPARR